MTTGRVTCITSMLNRGKRLANLESRIYCNEVLVAQANGNYAIFKPSGAPDAWAHSNRLRRARGWTVCRHWRHGHA